MSENYFDVLESRLIQLMEHCEALEQENAQLKASETTLREERSRLLQINDQTRQKVEAMIQRLKSLEQNR